jgi:hypothetical protein
MAYAWSVFPSRSCASVAFPGFDLSVVLHQAGALETLDDARERPTGVDLGKLVMVADQHHLRARQVRVVDEAREFAGTDHRRLIHDNHRVAVQHDAAVVEVAQQPVESHRRNLRIVLEVGGGSRRQGAADDLIARSVPGVASSGEGGGLTAARDTLNRVDTGAGGGELADHADLLARQ